MIIEHKVDVWRFRMALSEALIGLGNYEVHSIGTVHGRIDNMKDPFVIHLKHPDSGDERTVFVPSNRNEYSK